MKVKVIEIQFYERDIALRLPFKFGVITLIYEPQLFARVLVQTESGDEAWGCSAEALAPKWFDKNPDLTNEENFDQLRVALNTAAFLYLDERVYLTPYELFTSRFHTQLSICRKKGLNALIASFGQALLDRALLDAVCKIFKTSFYNVIQSNQVGIEATSFLPELSGFDFGGFLSSLGPQASIFARHAVGLLDPISDKDLLPEKRLNDGLPETLEEVINTYGNRYFKLKISGIIDDDIERLTDIAEVLDRINEPYYISLDGNEQFHEIEAVEELWKQMAGTPPLRRLVESILFIEQPIQRQKTLAQDVSILSNQCPIIIDESDEDLDAFATAKYLGYRGVSSKQCKGIYKSFINAARCLKWNESAKEKRFIMSGEDLTTQAGLAVQQDLALVNLLGLTHLERNGHHYVRGMADLSETEQRDFLNTHSDLYSEGDGFVHIKIVDGKMRIASLDCVGFASSASPDFRAMKRIR